MSNAGLEERVGSLEREQVRQGEELRHVRHEVGELKSQGAAVLDGINELRTRDAARPAPQNLRTVVGTLAGAAGVIAAMAAFVWWMIAVSPVVQEHEKRLTRLDDPVDGQVPRLRGEVATLSGWAPHIVSK